MRVIVILTLAIGIIGCHSAPSRPTTRPSEPLAAADRYSDGSSSALVFIPPISADEPELDLTRDPRTPSAFLGYDEAVVSSHYLRIDDRQDDLWGDRYERRSIILQSGVRYR